MIEYSSQDGCYVIQDLGTSNGTYINDCKVENAAVRLASGDIIRFGDNGRLFKFLTSSYVGLKSSY